MGRRAAEEEQNHWPGFVDALSTIVMVVTFLLIILAIVIFVLSQSIARSFIESVTEDTSTAGGGDMLSAEPLTATGEFQSDAPPTQTSENAPTEPVEQTEGTTLSVLAERALSDVAEVDGEDLEVRSRRVVDEEERIVVSAPDISLQEAEVRVAQAATVLTLAFDRSGTKITGAAAERVDTFLQEQQTVLNGRRIAIFAFTNAETGSLSQARRAAYYRALAARNKLLENGFLAENLSVEIRASSKPDDNDTVKIFVQN